MVEFDWSVLEKVGVAGICLAVIYFGFKIFQLVVGQWEKSTEAQRHSTESLNKNTKAFEKLSEVFEKQSEREMEFQERVLNLLRGGVATAEDTNRKVTEMHKKIV